MVIAGGAAPWPFRLSTAANSSAFKAAMTAEGVSVSPPTSEFTAAFSFSLSTSIFISCSICFATSGAAVRHSIIRSFIEFSNPNEPSGFNSSFSAIVLLENKQRD